MVGTCAAIEEVRRLIRRVAPLPARVLVTGETGTGKELVARAIHDVSPRRLGPFVAVNCGALPRELVEAELFGAMAGAFTNAVTRPGRFEQAHNGTLFLDEIGELPPSAQAVVLRALDRGEIQRLGALRPVTVDVRVISATNRDLAEAIRLGGFRRDLFHRLQETAIPVPPLRERGPDISLLIDALMSRVCAGFGMSPRTLSDPARRALLDYGWPGNVRELEHTLAQAVVQATGELVELSDLPSAIRKSGGSRAYTVPPRPAGTGLVDAVDAVTRDFECEWIRQEVVRHATLADAARALRLNARTLYEKMLRYGLTSNKTPDF
jgi:DNA-binding NtrC family response regulator